MREAPGVRTPITEIRTHAPGSRVTHQRTRLVGLLGVVLATSGARAQAVRLEFASDRPTDFAVLPATSVSPAYTLDDLTKLGLARNPRLADAALAVDAARGKALQAGLYPNPTLSVFADELNDRTGRNGILTLPELKQEIVTGGKLTLDRAVADREADQAMLAVLGRRAELLAGIRAAYFDTVALDRRIAVLREIRTLTRLSVEQSEKKVEAKQASRLDVVQLEVEAEKARAESDAAEQELPAAFRRLAATVGARDLPVAPLADAFYVPLPPYDLDRLLAHVLAVHPDLRTARVGVDRAHSPLSGRGRAVPNITVSGAFVRQNQNKSSDFSLGEFALPTWNRNQGASWPQHCLPGPSRDREGRERPDRAGVIGLPRLRGRPDEGRSTGGGAGEGRGGVPADRRERSELHVGPAADRPVRGRHGPSRSPEGPGRGLEGGECDLRPDAGRRPAAAAAGVGGPAVTGRIEAGPEGGRQGRQGRHVLTLPPATLVQAGPHLLDRFRIIVIIIIITLIAAQLPNLTKPESYLSWGRKTAVGQGRPTDLISQRRHSPGRRHELF